MVPYTSIFGSSQIRNLERGSNPFSNIYVYLLSILYESNVVDFAIPLDLRV